MGKMVPEEEARRNVEIMAKRCAMLYRHFSEAIIKELGEEKGRELIYQAITNYGKESGENTRQEIFNQGKEPTIANYSSDHSIGSDLPEYAWEESTVEQDEDYEVIDITRCPLADYWQEHMDPELARLYCYVDQAKYQAYNPDIVCIHEENVLDGDVKCRLLVKKRDK